MEHTAQAVAQWLLGIPPRHDGTIVTAARPVEVTIGKGTYQGALFTTQLSRTANERAVTEGHAKPGDKYLNHSFLLLGQKPKHRRAHICYVWKHDLPLDDHNESIGEWYVSCHSSTGTPSEHQPFGWDFVLSEWAPMTFGPYKGHKIDTLERFTYQRIPMSVKFLD